ncbi:hypothetical protein RND81_04G079200 [Saponaria officinalis]|uniref:Uncharacterized protein n=1 Tax=Saponaria officinalis TaxID=3572 RepID=A0AAW1LJC7_SAPOF
MEIQAASMENSQPQNNSSDDHHNYLPHLSDTNGDGESERKLSAEEVKGALETTASTGKFWIDWEELKSMIYFQLKQVLSEYPEATMSDDEQNSALGESYLHLVKRLEDALFSFIDGPPFTLQRLSEILLHARAIYPNLSKLALALEKNLLVTSTLTKSTEPYPTSIVQPDEQAEDTQPPPQLQTQTPTQPEPEHEPEPAPAPAPAPAPEPEPEPAAVEQQPETEQSEPHSSNGGELMTGDKDEVMAEVDAEEDDGIVDMEALDRIINAPDCPEPASISFPSQI